MNIASLKTIVLSGMAMALAVSVAVTVTPTAYAAPAGPDATFRSYLPIAYRNYPVKTVFGMGMYGVNNANNLDKVMAGGTSWVRVMPKNRATWGDVHTAPSTFNWDAPNMKSYLADVQKVTENGMTPIFILTGTPVWAQKVKGSGTSCTAIARTNFPNFAQYAAQVVARYSKAPYNVKYWEIWNEPDAPDLGASAPSAEWGCWGDTADQYFGGKYFGDMLAQVYAAIKATDPQAQVLLGGLLMDCNPAADTKGACTGAEAAKANRSRFFEGILNSAGRNSYDIVSFHAYDFYNFAQGQYGSPAWGSAWNTTGPVTAAKARFLKTLMAQYGVVGKGLMNTEVSLVQWDCQGTSADLEKTKEYYVPAVYAMAIAEGLMANVWFDASGSWFCGGLFDSNFPRNNVAYATARAKLLDATFIRNVTISGQPNIKAYEFNRADRKVWVIWALDGVNHNVTLPSAPLAAYGTQGNSLTPAGSMQIGAEPLYLEFGL